MLYLTLSFSVSMVLTSSIYLGSIAPESAPSSRGSLLTSHGTWTTVSLFQWGNSLNITFQYLMVQFNKLWELKDFSSLKFQIILQYYQYKHDHVSHSSSPYSGTSLCYGLLSMAVTNTIIKSNCWSKGLISSHSSKSSKKKVMVRTEGRNLQAKVEAETLEEPCLLTCSSSVRQLAILYHQVDSDVVASLTVGWAISHQSLIKIIPTARSPTPIRFLLARWLNSVSSWQQNNQHNYISF